MAKRTPTGRSVGRPTKCTPKTVKAIVDALSIGATRKLACEVVGLDNSTFCDWLNQKPEFAKIVSEAEGLAGMRALRNIQRVALGTKDQPGQWTASAWLLERTRPAEYGRRVVEVTGADGGPIRHVAQVVVVPAMAASADEWLASTQRATATVPASLTAEDGSDGGDGCEP